MSATPARTPVGSRLLLAAGAGAAIAVVLGVYGRVHTPSQELVFTLGFSSTVAMKVWLGTVAVGFAVVQVLTALWLYGKLQWRAPPWLDSAHRISGRAAFLVSLPVAYHCLWSFGFQSTNARVLAHSVLGCAFYGAFATKVATVRTKDGPAWALPLIGGIVFSLLVLAWCFSALWFIRHNGFPSL